MSDKERIDRLEIVVGTLMSYLHREIGTEGCVELLDRLSAPAALQAAAAEAEVRDE